MTKKVRPVLKRRQLQFGEFLDVSTGHVTQKDFKLLKRNDCPITSYSYPEGCWVHVAEAVTRAHLRRLSFSAGFAAVYLAAKEQRCWFIRFDCDGFMYERFPTYRW
jgi:hypothetical protein